MQGLSPLKCTSSNISFTGNEQQGNVVKLGQESLKNEGQAEGISGKLFVSENSKRFVKEVAHCSDTGESIASKLEESFFSAFLEGRTHERNWVCYHGSWLQRRINDGFLRFLKSLFLKQLFIGNFFLEN
ncbi:hypothetical protein HRI_000855800 [Hibiscus trionum]|uniref:Uncharacterized protein n=1 Tax=Hibiscus trionum TaxID=183268 RepID=A0A9W7H6H1_HIBTR|nr:hypothetical protein HRI_000855800 [Hibiscus trionum]